MHNPYLHFIVIVIIILFIPLSTQVTFLFVLVNCLIVSPDAL